MYFCVKINKMVKVKDIAALLEQVAPPSLQESYDNSGLLVGDPETEVSLILASLDCTEGVLDEAISKGCNMVLAHHPVIWGGLKRITGRTMTERVVRKAIKHDIALYACHTNLDKVIEGVNKKFAEKLGLKNLQILKPDKGDLRKLVTFIPKDHAEAVRKAVCEAGAGMIGKYDYCTFELPGEGRFRAGEGTNPYIGEQGKVHIEPEIRMETIFPVYRQSAILKALFSSHPYEEVAYDIYPLQNEYQDQGLGMMGELDQPLQPVAFLARVKQSMKTQSIRYYNSDPGRMISKVAICGGSGHFLLKDAISAGADAYITADVKYHEIMEADQSLLYADIGHYESEISTIELFMEIISQKFANIAILFSEGKNPVQYFI
jgi:dinuclear metal center YbgI/SA1388 family protein